MPTFTKDIDVVDGHKTKSRAQQREEPAFIQEAGVRALDGSFGDETSRVLVANRRTIITTLKKSLKFDIHINCFDINVRVGIIVICAAKIISVISLETLSLKCQLGKTGGCGHRSNINGCSISLQGDHFATCSSEGRIIVWRVADWKAAKVIDTRKAEMYQVEFSADGDHVLCSSADGRVDIYNWASGVAQKSCMRHLSAVRSFDFLYDQQNIIVCGQSDGNITVWNTQNQVRIENISPSPSLSSEIGVNGLESHTHTGAIISLRISPDQAFMASGSSDNTCKLWSISSYMKDQGEVTHEYQVNHILTNTGDRGPL